MVLRIDDEERLHFADGKDRSSIKTRYRNVLSFSVIGNEKIFSGSWVIRPVDLGSWPLSTARHKLNLINEIARSEHLLGRLKTFHYQRKQIGNIFSTAGHRPRPQTHMWPRKWPFESYRDDDIAMTMNLQSWRFFFLVNAGKQLVCINA